MKKKFCIYGNCQTSYLKACLEQSPDFQNIYEYIPIKPVFQLSPEDVTQLKKTLAEIDLFIHQPISDNYKGVKQFGTNYITAFLLKPTSKIISFPVSYFTGYHPEIFYLKDENGSILDQPFPYHDSNILVFYTKGLSVDNVLKSLQDPEFYDRKYLERNIEETIKKLCDREAKIDVRISQFILDNYQTYKLFHTINHPHISVFKFIAQSILDIVEISPNEIDLSPIPDTCRGSNTDYPVYPSVISNLNLQFDSKFEYRIRKEIITNKELITNVFDFYDRNPDLVQKAEQRILEVKNRSVAVKS